MRSDVLDHGYVQFVESWGSDERIVEAARMSTDKGFQGWGPLHRHACLVSAQPVGGHLCECGDGEPGDEKLLAYLYRNAHMTPFEMAGLVLEVQAPIFVFREWHRHRTQSYNELSARYTALPDLFYVPAVDRIQRQSGTNKQASGEPFDAEAAADYQHRIREAHHKARETYEQLLRYGVAREIARIVIPVSQYSRMRASANLRNWLAFLTLRMAPNAQWEIRQYANAVGVIVAEMFPKTWALFSEAKPAPPVVDK